MATPALAAKQRLSHFLTTLPDCDPAEAEQAAADHLVSGLVWHGPHPLNELVGPAGFLQQAWTPLVQSFPDLERRDDILLAGLWQGDVWCCATGHYVGTFARDYLGIPATGALARLRYGEFYRMEGGHVAEAYVQWDFVDLMRQAGVSPLPPDAGISGFSPAPATQDGVQPDQVDTAAGLETQRLVEAMIAGLGQFDGQSLETMGMERFWHPKMMWYGPGGIGSNRGIAGFQDYHQRPFLVAFPDRKGGNHKCRLGDGGFFATTGWPSVTATHAGPYLGVPATNRRIGMRVMDWWRRDGTMLRENWVFIDIPDLFLQFGVDVFARMRELAARR